MDLYAYSQIDLKENGINIPMLRGLRLMKDQELVNIQEEVEAYFICYIYPKAKSANDLHGKARKRYKLALKHARKQYDIFNKYVGKNVLYVNARIGGANWTCCGGSELEKHPLYLERVDDYFDSTYCDIYFKLKEN